MRKDDVLALLIELGADINRGSVPPLVMACTTHYRTAVEMLLSAGADTEVGTMGTTPLFVATAHSDLELLAQLLR